MQAFAQHGGLGENALGGVGGDGDGAGHEIPADAEGVVFGEGDGDGCAVGAFHEGFDGRGDFAFQALDEAVFAAGLLGGLAKATWIDARPSG